MEITEIEIDDGNEAHVTRHGVSVAEVHQVLANGPTIRRNRSDRTATHIANGSTDGGRKLIIPFIAKDRTARPITAWEVEQ